MTTVQVRSIFEFFFIYTQGIRVRWVIAHPAQSEKLKNFFASMRHEPLSISIHRNHLEFGLLSLFYIHIFLLAALLSCIYINGTEMRALNKTTVFSNLHFTRFHFRTRAGGTVHLNKAVQEGFFSHLCM